MIQNIITDDKWPLVLVYFTKDYWFLEKWWLYLKNIVFTVFENICLDTKIVNIA